MKRPQDSDIFGTKNERVAPRIFNDEKINPNAHFQSKMDAQYDRYATSYNPRHRASMTESQLTFTKVNEEADFDENYHKNRKNDDMQSTIFYEPTMGNSRMTERSRITHRQVPKHAYNVKDLPEEAHFGRKETLQREVDNRPENRTEFKGNSSNIFGYDEKAERNMVKNKIDKLIPYQMQWDEHDSIKCQDAQPASKFSGFNSIEQSESTVFEKKQEKPVNDENNSNESNKIKEKAVEKKQKLVEKKQIKNENQVEIMVLKGWNPNIMEGLSKYCRINNTKILSFNFESAGKGTLILDRSKRWETVTDWLRKDAKLKIRVK